MAIPWNDEDTICAVSTPPGIGGICVIRVSGSQAVSCARKVCPFIPEQPESHRVFYGLARELATQSAIDEVLASYFRRAQSFTGEDTVEISCHGNPTLSALLLQELIHAGCRLANPGEFTYRAFANGRLDLVQAESVLALIEGRSRRATQTALRQLEGQLSNELNELETSLTALIAHLEASIDFSTENLETMTFPEMNARVQALHTKTGELAKSYQSGRLLAEGLNVVLVGRPNVGKSSFLNAMVGRDRAIVTEIAGTTRDLIEAEINCEGVQVRIVDTAGIHESKDPVETIGIARAKQAAAKADVVFLIVDLQSNWAEDLHLLTEWNEVYLIGTKLDLLSSPPDRATVEQTLEKRYGRNMQGRVALVSSVTKQGFDGVLDILRRQCADVHADQGSVILHARQFELLTRANEHLEAAMGQLQKNQSPEFVAAEMTDALRTVQELLGKSFDEQIIDRIFREFCLGK